MKILIDLSNHTNIYVSVTIYALRILSGFKENQYSDVKIFCNPVIYKDICELYPNFLCIEAHKSNKMGIIGKLCDLYHRHMQIGRIDCDLIFRPALSIYSLFTAKKTIQTIHDLQGVKFNKGTKKHIYYLLILITLIRSNKIITISEFVKNDIKRIYPYILVNNIQTIYNSVICKYDAFSLNPVQGKYILYVGILRGHKNVITLLKAFNLIKNKVDHKLVIIGRSVDAYWEKIMLPFILSNNLESYIIYISKPIEDQLLTRYYQHANLLVHPSLMEGFGYTPIEAAILGTPVLTTKETALHETTMGLLNYYEPAKNESILAKHIMDILSSPPSKEKLKLISNAFLEQYAPNVQARKVWEYLGN